MTTTIQWTEVCMALRSILAGAQSQARLQRWVERQAMNLFNRCMTHDGMTGEEARDFTIQELPALIERARQDAQRGHSDA